jgi:hypothetical protein
MISARSFVNRSSKSEKRMRSIIKSSEKSSSFLQYVCFLSRKGGEVQLVVVPSANPLSLASYAGACLLRVRGLAASHEFWLYCGAHPSEYQTAAEGREMREWERCRERKRKKYPRSRAARRAGGGNKKTPDRSLSCKVVVLWFARMKPTV